MFNIKNLILLCVSGISAAIITLFIGKAAPLGELASYLVSGFLAAIILLISLSIKTAPRPARSKTAKPSSRAKPKDGRESGTVKWFDTNKGYGFITRSMGEDIFVHFRSIKGSGYRSLYEGQAVEFIVTEGDKGPQAEDIHIIK